MKKLYSRITAVILSAVCISLGLTACATFVQSGQTAVQETAAEAAANEEADYPYTEEASGPRSYLPVNPDGSVSYEGKNYKRNKHVKAILGLGIETHDNLTAKDSVEDVGTSDAIFLIAQDTAKNQIKVLTIPRNSMVEIDMIDDEGNSWKSFAPVNVAYTNGDGRHESCRASVKAVEDLLCGLDIDHYAAVDLKLIPYVNDAVGGVTVTVPNDQLVKVNPEWKEGSKVTLHGDDAERFIRYRDTEIDGTPFVRQEQHKAYIAGFTDALRKKSKEDSSLVSRLSDDLKDYMVTDMNKGEYEKTALDGIQGEFNPEKDMINLPGHAEVGEGGDGNLYDQWFVDYTQAIPVLLDLFYREID